ncbi:MAG: response regulator transcription factor [Holophagaceae bacterium]|nr:response regulator transcription factor [Holophagaceae bacterium]
MKQIIYAVEDDVALQELYSFSLENEFDCRCFDDGDSFFNAISEKIPNLVLLDIMLPGNDGFALLSRLKSGSSTSHIPVIMVSAKGDELYKVKGLNMGADDYIAKPFGVLELVARIKANLRKNASPDKDSIGYKDIFINFSRHQITVKGQPIQTTLKEYDLLSLLCESADKAVDRKTIFNKVWGYGFFGETRTLDVHIKELRKKLSDAGSRVVIQTIRGVGYMLV